MKRALGFLGDCLLLAIDVVRESVEGVYFYFTHDRTCALNMGDPMCTCREPSSLRGPQAPQKPGTWVCSYCRHGHHDECKGTVGGDTCACKCQEFYSNWRK